MRVLVVDDASSLRFMLRVLLEDAGIEVEEAGSGREALDRLTRPRATGFDAVVLDQRMPGLSGLEIARMLVERGPHPRLFLFSGQLHPLLEDEARDLGITTLTKADPAQLVAALGGVQGIAA